MLRPVYLTKSVTIGVILTVITAAVLVVLVIIAKDSHLWLVVASIIAFQLSFIWTCAELLDGPDEE